MTDTGTSVTSQVIAGLFAAALYAATYLSFVQLLRYSRNWLPCSQLAILATVVLAALTVIQVSVSPDGLWHTAEYRAAYFNN